MTERSKNRKTANKGLGSKNIDPEVKRRIQSMGGKASHGGGRKPGTLNRKPL